MITKEIIEYIKTERALGKNDDLIKQNLLAGGGWSLSDVQQAFSSLTSETPISRKSRSKSIVISIALIILLVGGGWFAYSHGIFDSFRDDAVVVPKTQDGFTVFNSSAGFSISHPAAWTVKEMDGVDASFGGVQLLSPGTSMKYMEYRPGDSIEQLITVGVGAALQPLSYEQVKTFYRNSFNTQYPPISRQITDERDIKINGIDAYEIVYTEKDSEADTAFENIIVVLLADQTGIKDPNITQIGVHTVIQYTAVPAAYDRSLAENIVGTFKENILQTYEQKKKGKAPQAPAAQESVKKSPIALFAQCLKDKDAIFYSMSFSRSSAEQKELFGDAAGMLPTVECFVDGSAEPIRECKDKKIISYPSWSFPGKGLIVGMLSLDKLSSYTGCPLPK